MNKIVLATGNRGKLREFALLLSRFGFEALPQADLGIGEADEPHETFVENALAKARHAARLSGLPALADDSGICALALGGAPGVLSARYAGEPKSDARNNRKLLDNLHDQTDRRAYYYCALVLVRAPDDPTPLIAEATWHGRIVDTPAGDGGFGYDPHFWLPEHGCTAAQMAADEKNRVSHRGQAIEILAAKLAAHPDLVP